MARICSLVLMLMLGMTGLHAQQAETTAPVDSPGGGTIDAAGLINSAKRALSQVVLAAQRDSALSVQRAEAKPFWDGLKDLSENLDKAASGLAAKDRSFFTGLAAAGSGFAQADVGLTMSGSSNAELAQAMTALQAILGALNENFSQEAARLKRGGELTESEKQQLDRLIAQQDQLLKKLDTVEKQVGRSNKQTKDAIEKMRKEIRKIKRSRRTVPGFVGGFFAAHILYDWLWGWHWWWGPWGVWAPDFIIINVDIWNDWVGDFDYDWDLAETYVETSDLGLADELEMLDAVDDADLAATGDFFAANDFSLGDDDLRSMTAELDLGWDDAAGDVSDNAMDTVEQNFDQESFYEPEPQIDTFDGGGISDFGGGFDDMDFDF